MSTAALDTARPDERLTEIEFTVGGMTCGSCANRVQKRLSCEPGAAASRQGFLILAPT